MKNNSQRILLILALVLTGKIYSSENYMIIDTGQETFYNNSDPISKPLSEEPFYGQDAQFDGIQPSYQDNANGTVTDLKTGLMWQKGYLTNKMSFDDAIASVDTFSLGGYDDWRVPTIKELYSLIMFNGKDPSGWNGSDVNMLIPFIDSEVFDFRYGIIENGERIIDAQYISSTKYVSTTMNGDETVFGVNFADGRIKGYPAGLTHEGNYKTYEVKYVRGNSEYGKNSFKNNYDSTISDYSTGLMWAQNDCGHGLNWQDALAWVQQKNRENYLGYNDWRIPNIKELHSILDYTRSPETTNSAAIDPVFNITSIMNAGGEIDYPYYWSGTTHKNMQKADNAAYFSFGRALGWMQPPNGGAYNLLDVHGAGAQRSDPKEGDPANFPFGRGPQGDVIRIYNFVRLVRDAEIETSLNNIQLKHHLNKFQLLQNYPNPFNPKTKIAFFLPESDFITLKVFNLLGQEISTLANQYFSAGNHFVTFNGKSFVDGIYLYKMIIGGNVETRKMVLLK